MSDVCLICSGHEASPVKVDVELLVVDKGSKEVEVIVGGMGSDKDDSMSHSKCEYGGGAEAMASEVWV